jgi:hypothetical protein
MACPDKSRTRIESPKHFPRIRIVGFYKIYFERLRKANVCFKQERVGKENTFCKLKTFRIAADNMSMSDNLSYV